MSSNIDIDAYTDESGYETLSSIDIVDFTIIVTLDYHLYIAYNETKNDLGVVIDRHYVLLDSDIPVGSIFLEYVAPNLYIPDTYFLPPVRGFGYCTRIYELILNSGVSLAVDVQTDYSKKLWESLSTKYTLLINTEADLIVCSTSSTINPIDIKSKILLGKNISICDYMALIAK